MDKKSFLIAIAMFITLIVILTTFYNNRISLPVIAIANYGPHPSLEAAIKGLKAQLTEQGFIENQNIRYEITDVGFDHVLIPQTIATLVNRNPKVMVVMSTPIAQFAKGKVHNIPLVYSAVTDPIAAGLIKEKSKSDGNMTGSSEMQDLKLFLKFAKSILPNTKNIGLLYATSDANDTALLNMMKIAASAHNMQVVAVAVDQARDVPIRMQEFKDKVDFIYVGASGPIQPALPAIAQKAQEMHIPVFNVEEQAVRDGLALASFGVNYISVGRNAGKLVASILRGESINNLPPIYPDSADHHGLINEKKATDLGIHIPSEVEVARR